MAGISTRFEQVSPPSEWIPYANYFLTKPKQRDEAGYYKPYDTGDKAFDYAWLLHQKTQQTTTGKWWGFCPKMMVENGNPYP